jgi:hypothetical protein
MWNGFVVKRMRCSAADGVDSHPFAKSAKGWRSHDMVSYGRRIEKNALALAVIHCLRMALDMTFKTSVNMIIPHLRQRRMSWRSLQDICQGVSVRKTVGEI